MEKAKRSALLYIYKILLENTDEEHFLSQQEIIQILKDKYDLELNRKTIKSNLDALEELDIDINYVPKKGYAIFQRQFEKEEIQYLNDAIFSSKSIPGSAAIELSNKLNNQLSKYQRVDFSYVLKSGDIGRTKNKEIFYNISILIDAIKKKKQICYYYLKYDESGNLVRPYGGKSKVHVSPYQLINNKGVYYLLCSYGSQARPLGLSVFRIEFMDEVDFDEEHEYIPVNQVEKNFDLTKYLNEHMYLFNKETIKATLEVKDPTNLKYIYDFFNDVVIHNDSGKILVDVKASETEIMYVACQFIHEFTLVSPTETVDKFKEYLKTGIQKYNLK